MEQQHRVSERFSYGNAMSILAPHTLDGVVVDVGAWGVGLELPVGLPVGSPLEMRLLDGHAVSHGKVVWKKPQGAAFRCGIQFAEEDPRIIKKIIKRMKTASSSKLRN